MSEEKTHEEVKSEIDKAFDALEDQLKDPKYQDRNYDPATKLEITAAMFVEFMTTQAETKATLDAIQQNLAFGYKAIEVLANKNAVLTLNLMKAHIGFVDQEKVLPLETKKKATKKPAKKNGK
jgi:hypothetical protein